jgi:calcineurin-like phosphoesterase
MASITEKKLTVAIEEARGNLTGAARRLGVSRQAVHDAVKKYGLDQLVLGARAYRVEKAEDVLDRAVEARQPWAVALTLKCLGKHLGYIERYPDVVAVANLEGIRRILAHFGVMEVDDARLLEVVTIVKAEMEAERA